MLIRKNLRLLIKKERFDYAKRTNEDFNPWCSVIAASEDLRTVVAVK